MFRPAVLSVRVQIVHQTALARRTLQVEWQRISVQQLFFGSLVFGETIPIMQQYCSKTK